MIRTLVLTLLFFSFALANKIIYLSYEEIPNRVIQGEIFPVTLKSISTLKEHQNISYTLTNGEGLELLDAIPSREKRGKYFYDTFHFLSTSSSAKLPDFEASISAPQELNTTTILVGQTLNIITLNPKQNFSNIIADNLELVEYKTTTYDKEHNIIIFVAAAQNANLKNIEFKNVYKQGIESLSGDYDEPRVTYFVVVDKNIENFSFSYFNLQKNSFALLNVPVVVVEDSVTTQSDLKPKDQSHERIKIIVAGTIAILAFIFILIRKKYIYLFFILIPLGYMAYIVMPERVVCIKAGANITLLPVHNGTIFETTSQTLHLNKEGSSANFTKIKLQNEKIGWVKNEDICSY
ncbi:MAG: hypothetical protein JXQ67_01230 [Campylobacterales bacterium]|nr:hypothetical protein [Campylobacterales bacterium]